jgi:two-component system sensor histidine kinase RegB
MATAETPGTLDLRRLLWLSSLAVPAAAVAILLAGQLAALPVRILPVATLLVVIVIVNGWTFSRLRGAGAVSERGLFVQLLVDVIALTGLLYYSGGATNPFVYLFLMPLAICAIVLPRGYLWAMAGLTAGAYTFLLAYRMPQQHLAALESPVFIAGMWMAFMLSVILTAVFIASLGTTMRRQERTLGQARERALQDERVVAVATLAAGAAHELSTPLATMAVVTSEMADAYPQEANPELHAHVRLLRSQVQKCKEALSVISAAGGANRAEQAERCTVAELAKECVAEVRSLRPGAAIAVRFDSAGPAPVIIVERTLRQALLNVLHNAVDASPREVALRCDWSQGEVRIVVDDHGPGMDLARLRPGEQPTRSGKSGGLGLGLFLTQTALSHLGGDISFAAARGGGASVTLRLPLARLQPEEGT